MESVFENIWTPDTMYVPGDRVVYGEETYVVKQSHYSSRRAIPGNKDDWYELF